MSEQDSREAGFSVLKMLLWLAVLGFIVFNAAATVQAYYTNTKVQDCFDSLSRNMAQADEASIRSKMQRLFALQYLEASDLPDAFYDALEIHATGHGIEISSTYSVTLWPFGKVEAIDAQGEYDPAVLSGLDAWRDRTRVIIHFEPYAISPARQQE